jgi:hypothetical protein
MNANEVAKGLRGLADWFEQHPEQLDSLVPEFHFRFDLWPSTLAGVRELRRSLGKVEKRITGGHFCLRRDFGGGVCIELNIPQDQVCKRVVTGHRVIPAKPAQPERVEEIVEWRCPESILAGTEAAIATAVDRLPRLRQNLEEAHQHPLA